MIGLLSASSAGVEEIAIGLMERMSKPRIVVSPPIKNRSKKGTVDFPYAWIYSPRKRKPMVFRPLLINLSGRKCRYSMEGRIMLKSPERMPPATPTERFRLDPRVGLK